MDVVVCDPGSSSSIARMSLREIETADMSLGKAGRELAETLPNGHRTPPVAAKANALLVCGTLDPGSNLREAGVACSGTANDRMPGQKGGRESGAVDPVGCPVD